MALSKDLLKVLRSDMDAALAAVAAKHNIVIKTGSASFTPTNATFKVMVDAIVDGNVETKPVADFKRYTFHHHIPVEKLGTDFTYGGKTYVLSGYLPSCHRFPILATEKRSGKQTRLVLDAVQRAMEVPTRPNFF